MNNDLISRSTLIQHAFTAEFDGKSIDVVALVDVDNAPTVETFTLEDMRKAADIAHSYGRLEENTERPKGEWIVREEPMIYECPFCGELNCCKGNFCPNCGADMRGGAE